MHGAFHQLYQHHPYLRCSPVVSGKTGHPYVSHKFVGSSFLSKLRKIDTDQGTVLTPF